MSENIGKTLCQNEIYFVHILAGLMVQTTEMIILFRIEKICANGDDNLLMVTKKGYNPTEVWPKRTGNKTGAIDAVLTVLTPPVIIKIPEGKVNQDLINKYRYFPNDQKPTNLDALCWSISKTLLHRAR